MEGEEGEEKKKEKKSKKKDGSERAREGEREVGGRPVIFGGLSQDGGEAWCLSRDLASGPHFCLLTLLSLFPTSLLAGSERGSWGDSGSGRASPAAPSPRGN